MPKAWPVDKEVPSVYVNADLLPTDPYIPPVFQDIDYFATSADDTTPIEFRLYAKKISEEGEGNMYGDCEMYCSTPEAESDSDSEGADKSLPISLEATQGGYIINKSVYIPLDNWNTLITIDKLVKCGVCEEFMEEQYAKQHAVQARHVDRLKTTKVLRMFDLSICRKIRNKYHCGVCNELFDCSNLSHFDSKMHEGNKLFAINKANDLMYDESFERTERPEKNECIHFRTNSFNDAASQNSSDFNDYEIFSNHNFIDFRVEDNDFYYEDPIDEPINPSVSYANMAKKPKIHVHQFIEVDMGNKKVKVKYDSFNMVISPKLNAFHCMVCNISGHSRRKTEHCTQDEHLRRLRECQVVDQFEDYFIRQVDDKLYHCGHCNNLQYINDMEDHIESWHPRKNRNPSELSMNNKNDTLEITYEPKNNNNHNQNNMGHNNMQYNKDNENTGINNNKRSETPDRNNKSVAATLVKNLSNTETQRKNLSNIGSPVKNLSNIASPVKSLSNIGSPVKSLSNKEIHAKNLSTIESQNSDIIGSPTKNANDKIGTPIKYTTEKSSQMKNGNTKDSVQTSQNTDMTKLTISNEMAGIYENIVLHPFGYTVSIPLLSYNVVLKRINDFYCGLCDFVCSEKDICRHIYEIRHMESLQRTPFIQPFSYNLIRAIRDKLHCAICNTPMSADSLKTHISDPQHMNSVTKALSQPNTPAAHNIPPIGPPLPSNVAQVAQNVSQVPQNVSQGLQNVSQGPQNVSHGPQNVIKVPQNAPVPQNLAQVPQNVGQVPQNVAQLPQNVGQVPKTLSSVPQTQNVAQLAQAFVYQKKNVLQNVTQNIKVPQNITQNIKVPQNITQNIKVPQNMTQNIKAPQIFTPYNQSRPIFPQNNQVPLNMVPFGVLPRPLASIPPFPFKNNTTANYPTNPNKPPPLLSLKFPFDFSIPPPNIPQPMKNPEKTEEKVKEIKDNIEEEPAEQEIEEEIINEEQIDEEIEKFNDTFDSLTSDDATFDVEEYVYLKLKNTFLKVSNASYNTLVHIGDGSRYCFVCTVVVDFLDMQKHVDNRMHMENIEKYRFLVEYESHLLRQFYLTYHCGICNLIITRKDLKNHLDWPTHDMQKDNMLRSVKKTRKTDIKGGVKEIIVSTQKENIFLNDKEPTIKIIQDGSISNGNTKKEKVSVATSASKTADQGGRKNKIVSIVGNVLKISWENWHGVTSIKTGYRCILCQKDLSEAEIESHCASEWHCYGLDKPLDKQYAPALVRKITESTLNCLICNTEVANKAHLIQEHMNGKKHIRNFDLIWTESSKTNTYSDCNDQVLIID